MLAAARRPMAPRTIRGDSGCCRQRGAQGAKSDGAQPGGRRHNASMNAMMTVDRVRGRSTPACWWRCCARPAGRCTRSTRWPWPGIGSAPRRRARKAITSMRWRPRTSCAPDAHLHRMLRRHTAGALDHRTDPGLPACGVAAHQAGARAAPPGCTSTTPASWPSTAAGAGSGRGLSTTQLTSTNARGAGHRPRPGRRVNGVDHAGHPPRAG